MDTPHILLDIVLPNGVVLDASIFDDRNYVEIDESFLSKAQETISRQNNPVPEPPRFVSALN